MIQLRARKGGEGRKLEKYDRMNTPEQGVHMHGRDTDHIFHSKNEDG